MLKLIRLHVEIIPDLEENLGPKIWEKQTICIWACKFSHHGRIFVKCVQYFKEYISDQGKKDVFLF